MSNEPDNAINERQNLRPPEMDLEPILGPETHAPTDGSDEKGEGLPDSDLDDDGTATPPYMKRE